MTTSTLEEKTAAPEKKHAPTPPAAIAPTRKKMLPVLARYKTPALIAAGFIAIVLISSYVLDAYTHEETDDAYVTGHLHDVSARINGVVTDVMVDDNQFVHQGDVLVKLDPSEYLALEAAAKANLATAQSDLDRQEPLVAMRAIAPEDVDKTRNTRDVDQAQYQLAKLQIDYSTITAPASGYIGRKNVEVGNRVSSGQTLMVVVEPDVWVVANFKETQLAQMQVGQHASITVDSIPGKTFAGSVQSFSPATGNEFALLPADNSTGNFTKIVQRVPVKIVFDRESIRGYEDRIRAGESAVVKVTLDRQPAKNQSLTQAASPPSP